MGCLAPQNLFGSSLAPFLVALALSPVASDAVAASAIAFTPSGENYSFSRGHANKNAAERAALKSCNEGIQSRGETGKCKVIMSRDSFGYTAVAFGSDGYGVGYSTTHAQTAVEAAYKHCSSHYKNCQSSEIPYYVDEPQPPKLVASAPQDCRPRTEYLRCSSSCTNGNCIVRYENGCEIRVRVSPTFNGFKNTWEFPSPRC